MVPRTERRRRPGPARRHRTSDISFISLWTLVSALVISAIGLVTLKLLAARSVRVMVTGVVLVSVATSMAGVAVIAYRMLAAGSIRTSSSI